MARVSAAVRREQIITAATAVIAREGVAGATTRRIASEANLSLATLHYVFETKDDILAAVLESFIDRARQDNAAIASHLAAPADTSPPALSDVIHRLVSAAWDLLHDDLMFQRAQHELILYALRTPDAAHLGRTLADYHLTTTEQLISQTIEHTGHSTHYPPRDLAHLVNSVLDGVMLDYLVNPDPEQTRRTLGNLTNAIVALVTSPEPAISTT